MDSDIHSARSTRRHMHHVHITVPLPFLHAPCAQQAENVTEQNSTGCTEAAQREHSDAACLRQVMLLACRKVCMLVPSDFHSDTGDSAAIGVGEPACLTCSAAGSSELAGAVHHANMSSKSSPAPTPAPAASPFPSSCLSLLFSLPHTPLLGRQLSAVPLPAALAECGAEVASKCASTRASATMLAMSAKKNGADSRADSAKLDSSSWNGRPRGMLRAYASSCSNLRIR
jgi:hypothetical protein